MTSDEQTTDATDRPTDDVGHGVTNQPRGSGDRDDDAVRQGADKLEQAGGGH